MSQVPKETMKYLLVMTFYKTNPSKGYTGGDTVLEELIQLQDLPHIVHQFTNHSGDLKFEAWLLLLPLPLPPPPPLSWLAAPMLPLPQKVFCWQQQSPCFVTFVIA